MEKRFVPIRKVNSDAAGLTDSGKENGRRAQDKDELRSSPPIPNSARRRHKEKHGPDREGNRKSAD